VEESLISQEEAVGVFDYVGYENYFGFQFLALAFCDHHASPQTDANCTEKVIKTLILIVNSVGFEYFMISSRDSYGKTYNC